MKSLKIALTLLGIAYFLAILSQCRVERETDPGDAIVIHLVHWQLEAGYREAMQAVIDDFQTLKAREGETVRIIQRAVPEQYYDPWLNTNLVGGTAPDIIQIQGNWWRLNTLLENFRQIDTLIGEPNRFNDFPYLVETIGDLDLHRNLSPPQREMDPQLREPLVLADYVAALPSDLKDFLRTKPLKATFTDGMIGGFNYDLGAYYSYPLSAAPQRLFFNKDLLRQVGYEEPPVALHEFLEMCEKLRTLESPGGVPLVPIAAFNDIARDFLLERWARPFTWRLAHDFDFLMTGDPPFSGVYAAWETGEWSFDHPRARAYFKSARELASHFMPGFMSMQRDQATFAFVQERAAMTIAGATDAGYLFGATEFEIGVTRVPLPGPGDPHGWDELVDMGIGQYTDMTSLMALNSRSAHPELAREFVEFLTSFIWNERFNRLARMMPSIVGAEPAPQLRAFKDRHGGAQEAFIPTDHPDYTLFQDLFLSQFWVYISRQIEDEERAYQAMVDRIEKVYADPRVGIRQMWKESLDAQQRRSRSINGMLQVDSAVILLRGGAATPDERARYERMVMRDATMYGGNETRIFHDIMHRESKRPFPGTEEGNR